jgi:hypothetical protein
MFNYTAKRTEDEKQFNKINKLPILKFNSYQINFIIKKFERFINNNFIKKIFYKKRVKFKELKKL